jgi:5'-nucleotidase
VAAATEGFLLDIPSIAVSLAGSRCVHFETAGKVARALVERFRGGAPTRRMLLNVNVPDVAYERLGAMEVTRLGKRHKAEPVVKGATPRGETVYWVGAAGGAQDAGQGTDFHAVANNCVSITPLQMDLTHFAQIGVVRDWIGAAP